MQHQPQHTMLRDANVVARAIQTAKGAQAVITVNDRYEHVFPTTSRISEALGMMTEKDLGEKLNGGDFFFVDDNLIDFRDGHYHGFVHTDEALASLMTVIGTTDVSKERKTRHRLGNRTQSNDIALSKVWNDTAITIPEYNAGGDFSSQLSFVWNPFTKNVATKFELVRQICTNGMVGLTPFINMQIPLVNRWEEHLEIANMQLQNKITGIMNKRLVEMTEGRASIADMLILDKHLLARMDEATPSDRERLQRIYDVVDPFTNLAGYYKAEALENRAMAAQLPAHLTVFDAWNIATEVCTHFSPTGASSDAGLQKLANSLVFDRECTTTRVAHIGKNIEISPFSSASRAFYGDVEAVMA